ncbi:hypothetical protein WH47_05040 [Habropoda laboriosa]|uniref:Uncharacterized protein n=1 Tax=Habropoda laboriosa TaxID=597456 RepID=A0A0L7QW23_9HYME|nr:hypothetical protein WH47_05040 [Habropoda laboriosa]
MSQDGFPAPGLRHSNSAVVSDPKKKKKVSCPVSILAILTHPPPRGRRSFAGHSNTSRLNPILQNTFPETTDVSFAGYRR